MEGWIMIRKTNNSEALSSGNSFTAKLFSNKAACLAIGAVAIAASVLAMGIVSRYYGTAVWWISCLFNLPFFVLFVSGAGMFISNIGRFSTKKFMAASAVSGAVMWVIMAVYGVYSLAFLPIEDLGMFWGAVGLELLKHILLPIVSLAIVFIPIMISKQRKKNA